MTKEHRARARGPFRLFNQARRAPGHSRHDGGGHLFIEHPGFALVDVYAAVLPTLRFTPGRPVNYAETVLPFQDGLPKQHDFPRELGGSGELAAE